VPIDRDYLLRTLTRLVQTPSINPAFGGGTTNERDVAAYVASELSALGMELTYSEPEAGRVSVVGRLRGRGGGRSLMLYAHHDTVGIEGMADPFSAEVREGKLYGRGAYDMKGSLAACLTAVKSIRDAGTPLAGDVLIAAVADEEVASIGMADVLTKVRTDAAIVTEATEMRVCLAHKGFCWIEVETVGRAAHGSRFQEGIDANMRMGRFLAQLDLLEQQLRASPAHRLVGPPSLHAAVLRGGSGTSTYAAHCRLEIERRMIPGETESSVMGEVQSIIDGLASQDSTFQATARPFLTRDSFEVDPDAAISRAVRSAATQVLGAVPPLIGEPHWMDSALLSAAGIETIVLGPCGGGPHADVEWVDLDSVAQAAEIYARAAVEYCR
jgi:acetylornithine deacetylase